MSRTTISTNHISKKIWFPSGGKDMPVAITLSSFLKAPNRPSAYNGSAEYMVGDHIRYYRGQRGESPPRIDAFRRVQFDRQATPNRASALAIAWFSTKSLSTRTIFRLVLRTYSRRPAITGKLRERDYPDYPKGGLCQSASGMGSSLFRRTRCV